MASDEVDGLSAPLGLTEAFSDPSTKHLAEFPKELKTQPVPLITFHGLNVGTNQVHATIWDAFGHKNDAAPINCVLRPSEYQFPVPKPKKQGYDRYVPHGIWKRNWLKKHMEDVPAVAVIFCDLDFRAANWPERRDSCVSMVHCLKVALMGRDTRLAVVLVQQTAPVPGTNDDATTNERVAALCSLCNVSNKSLFVLSYSDHLKEYTARLQSALFELSQSYYQSAARRVKNHRDTLNETVHQALFVRHPFKMAFFHEMKHDITGAIKLYQQAYGNLLKLRLVDANCHEIKTVAGFLNYKTCHLLFKASLPRDAILQFKKHIDAYARRVGPAPVTFQHHAWMSQQFQLFAEVFDHAIVSGQPALQTQHPGFYYQSSAYHVAIRRKEGAIYCKVGDRSSSPGLDDPLKNEDAMPYFGQRPWRAGRSLLDPDPTTEAAGFAAMQARERRSAVKYPEQIISLLSAAMAQFKKYHSSRMKRHLMVQTADEFTVLKEFPKALTLINHVVWDYRREKWWKLLSSLLEKALVLAYVTVSRSDLIRILIEFLGPKFKEVHAASPSQRDELQNCLDDVLSGLCPRLGLPGGVFDDDELLKEAKASWRRLLAKPCDQPISLDMTPIVGLWEVSCHFERDSYSLDDLVRVGVHVRLHSPHPMSLDKLSLYLNSSDRQLVKSREDPALDAADFSFSPGEIKSYYFEFFAESEDVGKQLTLRELKLRIVGKNGSEVDAGHPAVVDLCWNLDAEGSAAGIAAEQQAFQSFRMDVSGLESRCSTTHTQALITPHAALLKLDVEHAAPALLSEWYPVNVSLVNNEPFPVTNLTLKFALDTPEGFAEGVRIYSGTPDGEELGSAQIEPILVGDGTLEPGASANLTLHLKMTQMDEIKFLAQVSYNVWCVRSGLSGDESREFRAECACATSAVVKTRSVRAIEASVTPISLKMEPVSKLFVDEPSLLILTLANKSPWPVLVKRTQLKLDAGMFRGEEEDALGIDQIKDLVLDPGEKASECRYVVPLRPFTPRAFATTDGTTAPAMATYAVLWNRESTRDLPPANMVVPLPCPTVIDCPLWLEFRSPAHGFLRSSVAVAYKFLNKLDSVLDLSITMEASDGFMFSGQSQVKMRLMPKGEETLHYNLFPLLAGEVALPRLKIECLGLPVYTPVFEALVHRSVPARLFIMVNSK